ncbi:MAG: hypothetical protein H6Q67_785 [Firmicutes bacterium]|nr:hypothetical protein [Bacillota bacterium]
MTKWILCTLIFIIFNPYVVLAAPPSAHRIYSFSYQLTDQFTIKPFPPGKLEQIGDEVSRYRPDGGGSWLDFSADKKIFYTVGKQSFNFNDGFIASMGGVMSFKTTFQSMHHSASVFYGNNGQDFFATNIKANFQKFKNLNLEFSYFRSIYQYIGFRTSNELAKDTQLTIETAENLNTLNKGILITAKYKNARQPGQADLSVSYRFIEPSAISDYSTRTDFANTRGVRLQTTYKIKDDFTFSAFHDFTQTLDKEDNAQSNFSFEYMF